MFEEDNYIPKKSKDTFIDKSILSFVGLLSKILRSSNSNKEGILYESNAVIKMLSTLMIVILISLDRNLIFLALTGSFLVLTFYLVKGDDVKKIAALSFTAAIFTCIILIPSLLSGNLKNNLILIFKAFLTVGFVNLLSFTTKWHDVTKTLKLLFIPDIFILILDMTIRYVYILGGLSLDMLYALKMRTIGSNKNKYRTMSGVMGNLFLKSVEMGNESYSAMECRGFMGEYKSQLDKRITKKDIPYLTIVLVLLFTYLSIGGK